MLKTILQTLACTALTVLTLIPALAAPPLPEQSPGFSAKAAEFRLKQKNPALYYLEKVGRTRKYYVRPSDIDPRFTIALYVNVANRGPMAQRMWVLQRDELGADWKLGLWDERYWKPRLAGTDARPSFSWKISSGRKYPGDDRSGPTLSGVFTLDERKGRTRFGYTAPGMINVMYIDYHYRSGRRSGIAFHGTTNGRYRLLGRPDSHGCIRMTKRNARALLSRLRGRDGVLSDDLRWGRVPRFWKRQSGRNRYGYTRDGSFHLARRKKPTPPAGKTRLVKASFKPDNTEAAPLTKTGYRAIVVFFRD